MNFRSRKFIIISACVILAVAGFFAYRHWTLLRYEVRLANIKLFQGGEIGGGNIVQLPATYHRQEHSLSCEIAALKMALSVFGINPAESELIGKLQFDPTSRSKSTWGDPYTGFVGDINGKMGVTGYGVYAQPIADVGSSYARAEVIEASPQELAKQIDLGNPVVLWGYSGAGRHIQWTTPAGKAIDAVNGEHARTVVGYWGTVTSPEGFVIMDPIYGILKWKTADVVRNMEPFDNMAIVISKS